MMTPQIFVQLLKSPSGQKIFNSFLGKHRNHFDTAIGIHFFSKRYNDIDVSAIFYNHLMDYVVKDLSNAKIGTSFDKWLYDMSERRIKDIQSTVNWEVIKVAARNGGERNRNIACDLLLKEGNKTIWNVISTCFNDSKYNGLKKEIANVLIQRFYDESSEQLYTIDDKEHYLAWFYTCLKNLANRQRATIEEEVGIKPITHVSLDSNTRTNNDEQPNEPFVNKAEEKLDQSLAGASSNDSEEDTLEQTYEADIIDMDPALGEIWAANKLEGYLALMSNYPRYVELIRAIKIEGVDRETLAEEWECTIEAIYNMTNEAMTQLVKVALPDIRKRSKKMYKKYAHLVKDDYAKTLLKGVFEEGKDYHKLATEHKKRPSDIAADFQRAFKYLKRIDRNQETGKYFTDKEEKDEKRKIGWDA